MHIKASLRLSRQARVACSEPARRCSGAVQSAQWQIVPVVVQLLRLDHELHEICEALPIASDQGAMEDECVAMDLPTWLRSTLLQVKKQQLQRAIERLREAMQRREEDQRLAFFEAMR